MFDDDFMTRINKIARLDKERLDNFRDGLIQIGTHIRAVIDETPSSFERGPADMSQTKRIEWLERNVLKPASRVIRALSSDAMFAQYPNTHASALTKAERSALATDMSRLSAFASDLVAALDGQIKEKIILNSEMRSDFCLYITDEIKKHVPELQMRRSSFDSEHGDTGKFAALMRLIYHEITGEDASLDEYLKEIIQFERAVRDKVNSTQSAPTSPDGNGA